MRLTFRRRSDSALADAEVEPHFFQGQIQRMLKHVPMRSASRIERRTAPECEILELQPVGILLKLDTGAVEERAFIRRQCGVVALDGCSCGHAVNAPLRNTRRDIQGTSPLVRSGCALRA